MKVDSLDKRVGEDAYLHRCLNYSPLYGAKGCIYIPTRRSREIGNPQLKGEKENLSPYQVTKFTKCYWAKLSTRLNPIWRSCEVYRNFSFE